MRKVTSTKFNENTALDKDDDANKFCENNMLCESLFWRAFLGVHTFFYYLLDSQLNKNSIDSLIIFL